MGDATETFRPIWRTPLATVLAAWMAMVIGATLAWGRLVEVIPNEAALILAAIYIVPIPMLLCWGFWAMLREPMTGWLAPTVLLAFCGAIVSGFQPLQDAGTAINFAAHRPAYDAIVAEAARNRARGDDRGMVVGLRDGVRYRYQAERPGQIEFVWIDNSLAETGVRYDNLPPCIARPGLRCVDRGRPLGGNYRFYWWWI